MIIVKEATFNSPEGYHRASIVGASLKKDTKGEGVRLIFALISIQHRTKEFMAAVTYRPDDSTELIKTLEALTDFHIDEVISEDGGIIESALDQLEGIECDIEIVHVHNGKHKHPFCKVVQVTRPGELVQRSA